MPVLGPILGAIHVHRRLALGIGALCILGGGAIGLFVEDDKLFTVGFLTFLYGVAKLVWNIRSPEKHKAYLLLAKTPERIVWAYIAEVRGMRSGELKQRGVVLATLDGERTEIPTLTKDNAKEILAAIQSVAPHARLGYSPELDQQFVRMPASLRIQAESPQA